MNPEDSQGVQPEVKKFPQSHLPHIVAFIMAGIIILAGIYTGFWLGFPKSGQSQLASKSAAPGQPPLPQEDTQTFRDKAMGKVEKNDRNDPYVQGTHKLVREGGPSQTAYLVSSVIDLDQYVGKKVEVWGETFSSTKVGWLMDVGKVNVLE